VADSIRVRSILAVIEVSPDRFEELVGTALDGIPDALARYIDNVAVVVEDGVVGGHLLGRYQGVPLTERGAWYGTGMTMPDRVTIFRLPICSLCATEDDVVEQVKVTVVHEIAHHFGIGDRRLTQLGWG
jgi:predicted Zn-dependent protease with MMP-like domain